MRNCQTPLNDSVKVNNWEKNEVEECEKEGKKSR